MWKFSLLNLFSFVALIAAIWHLAIRVDASWPWLILGYCIILPLAIREPIPARRAIWGTLGGAFGSIAALFVWAFALPQPSNAMGGPICLVPCATPIAAGVGLVLGAWTWRPRDLLHPTVRDRFWDCVCSTTGLSFLFVGLSHLLFLPFLLDVTPTVWPHMQFHGARGGNACFSDSTLIYLSENARAVQMYAADRTLSRLELPKEYGMASSVTLGAKQICVGLASGDCASYDMTTRVWNYWPTGRVAVASQDGTITLWQVPAAILAAPR